LIQVKYAKPRLLKQQSRQLTWKTGGFAFSPMRMQVWGQAFLGVPKASWEAAGFTHHYSISQTVMHGTKMLLQKQQSRRRYAANGFAFVPLRAFLDSIRWVVETGQ
jgi:hypothetical protein